MNSDHRRGQPRKDLRITVKAEEQSRLQQYYSRNLSSGGIFLEVVGEPPMIGTKFRVSFEVPGLGRTIQADAEVMHIHHFKTMDDSFSEVSKQGIGLRFLDLKSSDKEMLRQYVSGKDLHVRS